jgi:hypothetical protein
MAEKPKTVTEVVGSGIGKWVRDPATGRFLTPQETVEKLRQAIEASDIGAGATQVDIETGQKRGLTKKEQLDIALAQLAQNISYEGSGFPTESAALLGYLGMGKGGSAEGFRNISRQAYLNNPSAWAISRDKIGQTIDISAGTGKAYDPSK